MQNLRNKIAIAVTAITGLAIGSTALAAADSDVVLYADTMASSLKDNIVAAVGTVLPYLAAVVGLVLVIWMSVRFFKRGGK